MQLSDHPDQGRDAPDGQIMSRPYRIHEGCRLCRLFGLFGRYVVLHRRRPGQRWRCFPSVFLSRTSAETQALRLSVIIDDPQTQIRRVHRRRKSVTV